MNNKFSVCNRSLGETETKHPNISPEKRQNRIEKKIERNRGGKRKVKPGEEKGRQKNI